MGTQSMLFPTLLALLATVSLAQSVPRSTKVDSPIFPGGPFYTGYMPINTKNDGYMFYVYIPSHNPRANSTVLWLQGGPGCSGFTGLFDEMLAWKWNSDHTGLESNPTALTTEFNLIMLENPVGTGFSFVNNPGAYVHNETQVGDEANHVLRQIWAQYPELQQTDFYIAGESYGGKYTYSVGYSIHMANQRQEKPHIRLAGVECGDGLTDPIHQVPFYADMAFNFGLIDEKQRLEVIKAQHTTAEAIRAHNWEGAYNGFNEIIALILNFAGSQNAYDFTETKAYDFSATTTLLNDPHVQSLFGVPAGTKWVGCASQPYLHLEKDFGKSVAWKIPTLLQHYKVFPTVGNFDIIVGTAVVEGWVAQLDWPGQSGYLNAKRCPWKDSQGNVKAYVRQYGNLAQATFRNSGHMIPMNNNEAYFEVMKQWINDKIVIDC